MVVQFEHASVELDLFVVPDSVMMPDAIIGRNILEYNDLQMVTDVTGTKLMRLPGLPKEVDDTAQGGSHCYFVLTVDDAVRGPLEDVLKRYQHMIAAGNNARQVTTTEMKIITKEDKVIHYRPYRFVVCRTRKGTGNY